LTPNQAFILAGLARNGSATARSEIWWPLTYNQVRGLLHRLRLQGLVNQAGFKHSAHIYTITPEGREALRAYEVAGRPQTGQGTLWPDL
jgi:DNA-binding PadR family transcriptional regulator